MDTREQSETLASGTADNPYVGPRTFDPADYWKFFGRERETRDLIARIISGRLLLFYAQSGAGKSSLLNTRVIPGLEEEGFEVLPLGSVSGHSGFETQTKNIFVYNLLSSLEQRGLGYATEPDLQLYHFLDNLVCDSGIFIFDEQYDWSQVGELKPRVLIIDQFEELFTTNTAFWEHRQGFFQQLAEALEKDEQLWIVLTMRQDFVAELRPYRHLLPDDLRNQFYMQQLGREDALMAIKSPVELPQYNRPFEPGAAELLVKNLLTIQVEGLEDSERAAEFVEPVQLQAVCYQMWEQLRGRPGPTITEQDVIDFADVDTALIRFYEDTISQTVTMMGVAESDLRHWFDTELVTEAGTRNMVFRGEEVTGGLPSAVADCVRDKFILREVVRPGGIWYELVHDRFVHPILESNRDWYQHQPLLQLAQQWADSRHSEVFLLTSHQLDEFSATNWQALGPLVAEYIDASRVARDQRQHQRNRYRNLAILAVIAVLGIGLVALAGSLGVAIRQTRQLNRTVDDLTAARRTLEATQADLLRRNADLSRARDELETRGRELETRGRELEIANNQVEALRLTDAASDSVSRGEYDAAILLSYQASKGDDSTRVRSVFLDALQNKLDRSATASPIRGLFAVPVDENGNPIPVGALTQGPVEGSLATIVSDGQIYWWQPVAGDTPPIAQRLVLPEEAPAVVNHVAFLPGLDLLATATGPEAILWTVNEGQVTPVGDVKSASGGDITALAFSPDGAGLALASSCGPDQAAKSDQTAASTCEGRIEVRAATSDFATGEPTVSLPTERPVVDMAFGTADGRYLIWTDGVDIAIEDLQRGQRSLVSRPEAQAPAITSIAASPDEQLFVAVGCLPPEVEVNLETEIPGSPGQAQTSPAQARQCASGDTGWREWWFLGENPVRVPGGAPDYREAAFLPDTTQFVFASDSAGSELDYLAVGFDEWQRNACGIAGRNLTAGEWQEAYPELRLTDYGVDDVACTDYPIHPSVVEALIEDCSARQGNLPNTPCWQRLEAIAGEPIDPEDLFAVSDQVSLASSLTDTQHTTAMRQLTEASNRASALPAGIMGVFTNRIAAVYDSICAQLPTGRTDSPAILEACLRGSQLDLASGTATRSADTEQRRWRFQGTAGDAVTIAIEELSGSGMTVALYDPLGNQVAYNEGSNPSVTSLLRTDGQYTAEVGWSDTPVPYTITVASGEPESLALDGATREAGSDQQIWRFSGAAGEWVTIAVEAVEGNDATLTVYNAAGEQVGFNDDADGRNPRVTTLLPADGRYTAVVGWYGTPQAYEITASSLAPDTLALDGIPVGASADQRLWQFEGAAGQALRLTAEAAGAGNATLGLYNDKGEQLEISDDADGLDPRIDILLPTDGTYTVDVGWAEEPDAYLLTAAAIEPAPLILDGVPVDGAAEQRLWRFDGVGGELATIALEALGSGDATLTLHDAQGKEIAYNDDFGSLNPQLNVVLPADGPYTAEVGWYSTSTIDPYTITGSRLAPQPLPRGGAVEQATADQRLWSFEGTVGNSVTVELEPFEEVASTLLIFGPDGQQLATGEGIAPRASTALVADGTYTIEVRWTEAGAPYALTLTTEEVEALPADGNVPRATGEQRSWRFRGSAGETLTVAVTALEAGDPTLTLYDPQGTQLNFNDDFSGLNPQLTQRLSADGDYTIAVGWLGTPAPYSLTVNAATPAPLPDSGAVAAESGETAWWFVGEANEWVTIAVTAEDFDPRVALYDTTGQLLRQNDDFNDLNPLVTSRLPANGRYDIEVWWREAPQPYNLALLRATPQPLPDSGVVSGTGIEQRLWQFAGTAGQTVTIAVDAPPEGNAWLRLFDAAGNPVAFNDNSDSLNPRITYTPRNDGLYVIEVGWYGTPGPYDLAVTRP